MTSNKKPILCLVMQATLVRYIKFIAGVEGKGWKKLCTKAVRIIDECKIYQHGVYCFKQLPRVNIIHVISLCFSMLNK